MSVFDYWTWKFRRPSLFTVLLFAVLTIHICLKRNEPLSYVVKVDLIFVNLLFTFKYFWNLTPANSEGNLYLISQNSSRTGSYPTTISRTIIFAGVNVSSSNSFASRRTGNVSMSSELRRSQNGRKRHWGWRSRKEGETMTSDLPQLFFLLNK